MLSVSNILKTAALAAVLSLGGMAAGTAPASADTYTTRCFGDDCYRVRCDDFGTDCVRASYYGDVVPYAPPHRTRMVCDEYGDNCHYVTIPGYYDDQGIWHPDY